MEFNNILLLGGCGFIGRNFVSYFVSKDTVKRLRVVDKVPPQVAWLDQVHRFAFEDPRVEFKSANLINSDSCKIAFDGFQWDLVVNCAGETKPSQTDPVYKEGILKVSLNCAKQAAQLRVKRYIEISAGQVASSEKIAHREDQKCEPWTYVARWKLQVEKELSKIPHLNYTVIRPALVYGKGDKQGLTARVIVAALYQQLGETMKLLWNADVKLNTVHVNDVCAATWFACNRDDTVGQVYNVVDDANSTQGSITDILANMFNIKVDYYGNLVSSVVDLGNAADDANDKHLLPWAEACSRDDIQNTPLTPHMDFELLLHKHLHLDGNKLKRLGFQCNVPRPTETKIRETIDYFLGMGVFPLSLVS